MNVHLNYEQRARLELISIHAGKPSGQILVEAATFLLSRDTEFWERARPAHLPRFLPDDELDARLAHLLHH